MELTSTELEVMRILWEHGELNPPEIEEKYSRPIKNAALRFQLKVLLEKGHVTRRRVGKAYYYQAKTPRMGSMKQMVRRMADIFTQGSTSGLIAELIKAEKLSPTELETLKELAENQSTKTEREKKS